MVEQKKNFKDIKVFVPWEPLAEQPGRIFVWDETGGKGHWVLPASWRKVKKVYVYKLTDQGRIFDRVVSVSGGAVDYTFEKETPYVFYSRKVQEISPADMKGRPGRRLPIRDLTIFLYRPGRKPGSGKRCRWHMTVTVRLH